LINFFNNDIIISSLVTNLNSLTAIGSTIQDIIVNWVTTADGCVHTADATRQLSGVDVGGVNWALMMTLVSFVMKGTLRSMIITVSHTNNV